MYLSRQTRPSPCYSGRRRFLCTTTARRRRLGTCRRCEATLYWRRTTRCTFTRLLDAQVDVLVALDDVCDARKREGDAQVWIAGLNDDADSMPRPMEGRWVAMALAPGNDTVHGSRLLL